MQDAARIFAKDLNELSQLGMVRFQAPQLVRFERKKRCLQSGKQGGTEDQDRNDSQQESEDRNRHSLMRKRRRVRSSSEKIMGAGLLIV